MYDIDILLDPARPGVQCDPQAVGGGGRVVGVSDGGGPANYVAMAWDRATLAQAAAAGSQSVFSGVNNLQQAVGARGVDDFASSPAIIGDGLGIVDLPVPPGGGAIDINDAGQIVGWDSSDPRGYRLDHDTGALARIDALAGYAETYPLAINAGGEIVGTCGPSGPAWVHAGGVTRELGVPWVGDINDSGLACATTGATQADLRPVICDTRQAPVAITAIPLPPGFASGIAEGINNAGDVVGFGLRQDGSQGAFICSAGVSTDLGDLVVQPGWALVSATAISDAGQIIGLADFGGQRVGYVMSPADPLRTWLMPIEVLVGVLLGGVAADGGGWIVVGGKPRPVGPWGGWSELAQDKRDALIALALDEAARSIADDKTRKRVRAALVKAAGKHAKALIADKGPARKAAAARRSEAPEIVSAKQVLVRRMSQTRG